MLEKVGDEKHLRLVDSMANRFVGTFHEYLKKYPIIRKQLDHNIGGDGGVYELCAIWERLWESKYGQSSRLLLIRMEEQIPEGVDVGPNLAGFQLYDTTECRDIMYRPEF